MRKTHRKTESKKSVNVRSTTENAITVNELKMEINDSHSTRTGRNPHESNIRTRTPSRSDKPSSFQSKSHNSLGVGELTRLSNQKKSSPNEQVQNHGVATSVEPIIRPSLLSSTTVSRTTRVSRPGPMRAPFLLGSRGKGIPPLEDIRKPFFHKVIPNIPDEHNKNTGKITRLSHSTDSLISRRGSNQQIKGTSPASNIKRNTPAVGTPSEVQSKRHISNRSSSIDPNSRNNKTHSQNIKHTERKNRCNQSTENLLTGTRHLERPKGDSPRSRAEPKIQKNTCLTKASFAVQISPHNGGSAPGSGVEKPNKHRRHKNILPVEMTEYCTPDTIQYHPRIQIGASNDNTNTTEKTNEAVVRSAEQEIVQSNPEYLRARRADSFDGTNTKDLLYGGTVQDEIIPKKRPPKAAETATRMKNYEVVQTNPEYMHSKRSDSFDGTNTKDLLYGGTVEKVISSKKTSVQEAAARKRDQELVKPDPEYMFSRRSDSFDGKNTKDILYGGTEPEDITSRRKSVSVTDRILSSGRYKYVAPCVRNSVGIGGENAKNLIYGNTPSYEDRIPNKNSRSFNTGSETVMDEDDHQAKLRANRNACLGGGSMKDIMTDNLMEAKPRNRRSLAACSNNEPLVAGRVIDINDEDQRTQLRANRSACLGGSSIKNLMCDDFLEAPSKSKNKFATVEKNEPSVTGIVTDMNAEDHQAQMRVNRSACLGGDSIKNLMCDDFLEAPIRNKKKFFASENNEFAATENMAEVYVQDPQAKLRKNRTASLGGNSMKNLMVDDFLEAPTKKNKQFLALGNNEVTGNVTDVNEQDPQAKLRANRKACLSGDSIKNLMCDDHLEAPTRNKNKFVSSNSDAFSIPVSENIIINPQTKLRQNRSACLGGDSMKNLMCDDFLEAPKWHKNISITIGRNRPKVLEIGNDSDGEDQQVDLSANRNVRLGGTDEPMKVNRSASMGGSDMKSLLYSNTSAQEVSGSCVKTPRKRAVPSSLVSENFTAESDNASRANRSASMGGSDMRGLLYGQTTTTPESRCRNKTPQRESVRSSSENYTVDTDKALKANRSASMGGSGMKSLLCDPSAEPSSRVSNRTTMRKPLCSSSENFTMEVDRAFKSNRSANMEGSDMKNLLYGNTTSSPASRSSNRTSLKKSVRSSSVSGNCTVDTEKSLKANRSANIGGSDMKSLLYGNHPTPTVSRSNNKTSLKKSVRGCFSNSTVDTERDLKANRSSSMEGSNMKGLLYGGMPSPPASRSSNRTSSRNSTHYAARNSSTNITKASKTNRSVSKEGSHMKSLIYGRNESSSESRSGNEPSSRPTEYANYNISTTQKCGRVVASAAEIQEQNEEIRRANRFKGIGGSSMKNLIYGDTTNNNPITETDISWDRPDSTAIANQTIESNQNSYEALRYNRNTGMGGSNMKSLIYGSKYMDEEQNLSPRGPERNTEQPIHETETVIHKTAFEGNAMKNLIYGGFPSERAKAINWDSEENNRQVSHGEDTTEMKTQNEIQSSTPVDCTERDEDYVSFDYFSADPPTESKNILIPYDVLNQFAPECEDNIERTAVKLKHGCLVDCTCETEPTNEQQPCVKHIEPDELQFYPEAVKVVDILSSPIDRENERKTMEIENNLAREYPNYYNNFVQKFSRQMSEDYHSKERQGKLGMVTSCRKLLAEEHLLSNAARYSVNRNVNISGKIRNLDKDFEIACKIMKEDYPALFVQLLEKYSFPNLAFEKMVVEQNRSNLMEISKLGTSKLLEFDNMFTSGKFDERI